MTDPAAADDTAPATAEARAKGRATWTGLAVNLPLAVVKIVAGALAGSSALVADGVHSLADTASDVTVLWALGHSARGPDAEHPYGHGRFETLATLAVAAALLLSAAGILWDAATRLMAPATLGVPGLAALAVAALSIALKEGLYHYTLRVGRRTGSALIVANAWHHRSDALSSVVALIGIGAAMTGLAAADALAAAVIAAMLLRVAWTHGRPAIDELVDSQHDAQTRRSLARRLLECPGVEAVRELRLRRHGTDAVADGSILVDPEITVTEGHRIAEAARAHTIAAMPALSQLVLHVEPAGHHDGYGATRAPLRDQIEGELHRHIARLSRIKAVESVRLGYFDDGIEVEIIAVLQDPAEQAGIEAELGASLRRAVPGLGRLRLHLATDQASSSESQ